MSFGGLALCKPWINVPFFAHWGCRGSIGKGFYGYAPVSGGWTNYFSGAMIFLDTVISGHRINFGVNSRFRLRKAALNLPRFVFPILRSQLELHDLAVIVFREFIDDIN